MNIDFPSSLEDIKERISAIDPIAYGKTRNYIQGSVTYLSPYISRGVISTRDILESVIGRGFQFEELEILIKELLWREFFQRTWQHEDVDRDLRFPQDPIQFHGIPCCLETNSIGITAIYDAISQLKSQGYMHNHSRMYLASIVCNVGQYAWYDPARWMYYYLLDGDWASNACSWQWVAGSNSTKKYYANQENINVFSETADVGTFLDTTYEDLPNLPIPDQLQANIPFELKCKLPETSSCVIDTSLPTFIYNYYNLDPLWHSEEKGNRILLLEPTIFERYPISDACIQFMLALSKNIKNIQIYIGSFDDCVREIKNEQVYFKDHPLNRHYKGICEDRTWIQKSPHKPSSSFSGFYKNIKAEIEKDYFHKS
jgi:deoxyribodipyrimidine photo-lyase